MSINKIRNYTRRGAHGRPASAIFARPVPAFGAWNATIEAAKVDRRIEKLASLYWKMLMVPSATQQKSQYVSTRSSFIRDYPARRREIRAMEASQEKRFAR